MSRPPFRQLLLNRWEKGGRLCVGLDPDPDKIPGFKEIDKDDLAAQARAIEEFLLPIIEKTHHMVLCYKPNEAFYERFGAEGLAALKRIMDYIHGLAPDIPIIDDAKRGDIGNTNKGYVDSIFGWLGFDACTVSPYLGLDALRPFIEHPCTNIVLVRTSNPGAPLFQDRIVRTSWKESGKFKKFVFPYRRRVFTGIIARLLAMFVGEKLYRIVAREVAAADNGTFAVVVGATYPEEMWEVRAIIGPKMPILIPGIGNQGGNVEEAVNAGLSHGADPATIVINSSSGVIHAKSDLPPADAALVEALKTTVEIGMYVTLLDKDLRSGTLASS